MVAYITNARCWIQWKGEILYASWKGKNILLNPVHDWMHDCIRDWTRKWDPALMTSAVWPNSHQGIIYILSGGTMGIFCEPSQRQGTKVKAASGTKRRKSRVFTFSRILGNLGTPNQPSGVFFKGRGLPKSRLCLWSDLATDYLNIC